MQEPDMALSWSHQMCNLWSYSSAFPEVPCLSWSCSILLCIGSPLCLVYISSVYINVEPPGFQLGSCSSTLRNSRKSTKTWSGLVVYGAITTLRYDIRTIATNRQLHHTPHMWGLAQAHPNKHLCTHTTHTSTDRVTVLHIYRHPNTCGNWHKRLKSHANT